MIRSTFDRRRAFNLSPQKSGSVFEEMLDETLSLHSHKISFHHYHLH